MNQVHAPWTAEQVENLRKWQASGYVHPFTNGDQRDLIPTVNGWIEEEDGPVAQTWAYDHMLDGSFLSHFSEWTRVTKQVL